MNDHKQRLTPDQMAAANLVGWEQVEDTIQAEFDTGDFATGLRLLNLIGESAEAANHHPDLTLTYPSLAVTLSSHDIGGLSSRDVDLARQINEHAASLGVEHA